MSRYLYMMEVSKVLNVEQVEALRQELGRVFQSNDVIVEQGKYVKLHSAFPPDESVDLSLQKLVARFGPIILRAGSKVE